MFPASELLDENRHIVRGCGNGKASRVTMSQCFVPASPPLQPRYPYYLVPAADGAVEIYCDAPAANQAARRSPVANAASQPLLSILHCQTKPSSINSVSQRDNGLVQR